ncbi:Synaptic vesicle membrane protein VAT-1 -like [Portunus trituberculatus]|uniref:Synaptic vesicle membrane protein VAT-1-like n=1 Tax=Portunus trituberculatus TaxID=210409 RepID=A0A5B7E8P9_PORTR|nr:Synaptic vesicle membrane protein VAT-1 -like [Portunus trituberculatus]
MDTQTNAETKGEAPAEAKPAQEAEQQDTKTGEAEAPKEMRAVVLNGFGGLKSVKIVRRPEPALADGEVLIRVQLWVCPDGVDVVLDSQGGEECNRGYTLLKPLGRYILFGSSSIVTGETKSILSVVKSWWQVDKVSPLRLYEDNRGIIGFNLRRLLHHQNGGHEKVRSVVETVYKLWQSGVVKAHIDSTYALEDVSTCTGLSH